jgi:hypothetical protein
MTQSVNLLQGVVGAAVSGAAALTGQKHRSGPNFQMIAGGALMVECPLGLSFDIMWDKTGGDATVVTGATAGTKIASGVLTTNINYYIANPENATGSFAVLFAPLS